MLLSVGARPPLTSGWIGTSLSCTRMCIPDEQDCARGFISVQQWRQGSVATARPSQNTLDGIKGQGAIRTGDALGPNDRPTQQAKVKPSFAARFRGAPAPTISPLRAPGTTCKQAGDSGGCAGGWRADAADD